MSAGQGSGTYSDWAVMSRFRNIIAPKAQGESVLIALKFENTAMPIATQTLTEGWEATNAMFAAGTSAQYPAAHWARELVINGYSDWYIPARDELELAWRNLKPILITLTLTACAPHPLEQPPQVREAFIHRYSRSNQLHIHQPVYNVHS